MNDSLALQEVFSSVQGEGLLVGVRQIFLRLYGCHLDCVYCDTPETKITLHEKGYFPPTFRIEEPPGTGSFRISPNPIEPDDLRRLVLDLEARYGPHHSVSVTGGEPLLQSRALVKLLPRLRDAGLSVYLETAGDLVRQFKEVAEFVDWVAMDIKLPSATDDVDLFARHDGFLEAAGAVPGLTLFLKCVVTADTKWGEIEKAALLSSEWDVTLFLQPVTPVDARKSPPSPIRILEWQSKAAALTKDVRVVPQLHKELGQL